MNRKLPEGKRFKVVNRNANFLKANKRRSSIEPAASRIPLGEDPTPRISQALVVILWLLTFLAGQQLAGQKGLVGYISYTGKDLEFLDRNPGQHPGCPNIPDFNPMSPSHS